MSLTQAVLAQQRHGQPHRLFAALEGITGRLVGHRLFTLLAVTDGGRRVQRVYSSNPSAYPVGGAKEMGPTPWGELVIRGQQPYLGRDAHDIRWAFPDHALISSLGLASVVNLPVVYDGTTIGVTAMLHEAYAPLARATGRRDRVIGIHFFNPVAAMPLVEIVRGRDTSAETEGKALELVRSLGKEAVRVHDSPGFATSRLGVALGLEAMRMVEEGIASAEDIDRALELGYGHRMGPLKTTDLVGLDVRLAIAETLAAELPSDRFTPPEILRTLVAEGRTGRKSGEGFYRWDGDKAIGPSARAAELARKPSR